MYAMKEIAPSKEKVGSETCTTSEVEAETNFTQSLVTSLMDSVNNKAEVNKMSEFSLCTAQLRNNKPSNWVFQIDCLLESLIIGSVVKGSIEEIGADKYCIQYTPTVRGRHKLIVSVDGQQVEGSPFSVFVTIPPTLLDKPIKAWRDIAQPNGITVNSVGEIIVTEYEGDVVVLDKEGTRLRSIKRSQYQLERLRGVAVDSEDNIFFTDIGTNRIFKSDRNCSKVEVRNVSQVNSRGHIGIAVVGNEVMVTEDGNEGSIIVYDRDLEYVRKIVGAGKNSFYCLSLDCHQNVYASFPCNSSIEVFGKDGQFLRSIGSDVDVKRLKSPSDVCVTDRHVYVADFGVDKIVVFTTEGKYVTSFGDCGGKYDVLCVDQEGSVYACNYKRNRIDIY